ncbi:hypothetical protein SEVIR_7G308500v4 [Setaria viridis]|uniref:Clp R domain-containing protein n=1 Tax=Setaria viridis TaxID=4556 RepID=A0A4U6UAZ3_SETVI|nr:protein SMAX1-LIKE 3-like [Setaria viridis]TKW07457.1 hypothetical protein SEVIR_7G308500v2 [Setaria viridis]
MHASICTRTAEPPEDQAGGFVGFGRPASYLQEREEMRSGGCAVQQELAPDAAAVMRQAVSLARRRGHAQVTPLHAASAMLADAGGLLRAACLRSRASSHPLQCKALELCFNVALNRLATAGPPAPAMFQQFHAHHAAGGHRAPTLSNALAAAFKRAQANQRRGAGSTSADVAARVELEQLVISILDDPGVSRVMREAGFSSAEVKANVEKAASSPEQQSSNTASSTTSAASPNTKPSRESNKAKADAAGDAARVLDCMASWRSRCVAVVGESAGAAEGVVKAVMDKVSKGDLRLQHECLKNAQLVPFSAASFQRLPREEVDARAGDLRAIIREARAAGKGVVLVLEDLACAAEAWAAASWKRSGHARYYYCPVEHAVMELSNLVRGGGGRGHDMFWLLGFSAYASYTSCRSGQPSLEAVLELHPILVPDGSLAGDSEITHCGAADMAMATAASVPSWIRRCQQQGPVPTGSELTLSFSSPASSSLSGFAHHDANMSYEPRHDLIDRRRQPLHLQNHGHHGPTMADSCDQQLIASPNPGSSNSVSKSNSSDGATEPAACRRRKFTELTAENLKILCGALEARVPRHRDIAPGIASAVLQRRSGVTRMTRPSSTTTWLLFKGRDSDGKTAMARELARLVFGSYAEFTCITAPELTLAPSGSNSGDSLKRQRSPDDEHGYMQRLYEAIRDNPHRVVMIDGAEHDSEDGIKNAMATGTVRGCDGDAVSLEDAIVVSCDEVFESSSRVSSPRLVKQQRVMSDVVVDSKVEEDGTEKGDVPRFGLDLNACAAAMDGEGEERSPPPNDMEILKAVDGVFFFQY